MFKASSFSCPYDGLTGDIGDGKGDSGSASARSRGPCDGSLVVRDGYDAILLLVASIASRVCHGNETEGIQMQD